MLSGTVATGSTCLASIRRIREAQLTSGYAHSGYVIYQEKLMTTCLRESSAVYQTYARETSTTVEICFTVRLKVFEI